MIIAITHGQVSTNNRSTFTDSPCKSVVKITDFSGPGKVIKIRYASFAGMGSDACLSGIAG